MKSINIYKWSLFLPLIVPLLFALPLLFVSQNAVEPFGWFSGVMAIFIYSGMIGGIPYAILAGFLLFWMRGKTEKQIRCALFLAPILLIPMFFAFITLLSVLRLGIVENLGNMIPEFIFYIPFLLGFGYGYVALVFGAIYLLKRMNKIKPLN